MFMQSKIRPKSRLPSIAAAAVIGSFLAAGSAWAQMDSLSIMAPASPGGGWDGTARAMQQALQKENIVKNVEVRSEEHTSELQSLMRISYAVFCLKKKMKRIQITYSHKN